MKTLFIAALLTTLAAPAIAYGQTADQETRKAAAKKQYICLLTGNFYQTVASYRDSGETPDAVLKQTDGYSKIPLENRKKIINNVFFDRDFQFAGGTALSSQVANTCMFGSNPKMQPLK